MYTLITLILYTLGKALEYVGGSNGLSFIHYEDDFEEYIESTLVYKAQRISPEDCGNLSI